MTRIQSSMSIRPVLPLLQRCTTMAQLKEVHAHTIATGFAHFTFITSKILAFCALPPNGDINYAQKVFSQIPAPSVFNFNSMIRGFTQNSLSENGLFVFAHMRSLGVMPNNRTFTHLVKCCISLSWLNLVHGQILKFGHISDAYVISSIISMYSKCSEMNLAHQIFDEIIDKNVVSWTTLLSGYCSNGLFNEAREIFDAMPLRNEVSCSAMVSGYVFNGLFNEAIELFRLLKRGGNVRFNGSLLVSVLNACSSIGAFDEGKWIHHYVEEEGHDCDHMIGTALIDFYAKCGCIKEAFEIFSQLTYKDVTSWTAMILGLAFNGENEMGLALFSEMEKRGPIPNAVTFVGVLTACNHKMLLNEAWKFFGRMFKVHGITPTIEHYGCMVDLLARSGLLKEVEILIKSMPIEPDGDMLCSLLNGCLMHGYVEVGEMIGRLVIQWEPQYSGRYALLSNLYAVKGSWDEVMSLREMMRKKRVASPSAWSSIEIHGVVHKFHVDDKTHYHLRCIYRVLNQLSKQLGCFSIINDTLLCQQETF